MSVFWHHVGDEMSTRDFPKTIGTKSKGLVLWDIDSISQYIEPASDFEAHSWLDDKQRIGNSKFQIWGLPAGAKTALKNVKQSDLMMLLNSQADYGFFEYIGKILARIPGEQWRLSQHLWGEGKFPIILLLVGKLIHYPFPKFKSDLGYGAGLKGMGRVHSIGKEALKNSKFSSESGLLAHLGE